MQKERVAMLGSSQVWLMPVTGFCSPLKWTWLKYLPGCAVLGCCTHLCDRSSGCLMGEVIRHLRSASTCWRNLEHVFSQVVTGTSFASLEISDLFSCCAFFSPPNGKCSSLFLSPVSSWPALHHDTWLHPSAALPLFYGSMLLGAEFIFQKTDGGNPVLSK